MSRRTKFLLIGGLLFAGVVQLGFLGLLIVTGVNDKGSPALAAEWRAELLGYDGPEEAASQDPDVVVLRFDKGEWAIGLSQDSHGLWRRGGGTVVVRDSRGAVRAFRGAHVCGPRYLDMGSGYATGLDSLYERLDEEGFREFRIP